MWACSSVCIYSDSAVLNFGLRLHLFNLFVEITDEDHSSRFNFCLQLQDLMSSDDHFLEKAQFSDEATFHVSGAVNRRNVRIRGSENPHRCTHVDACVARTWISYRCVHTSNISSCQKKNQFSCGCEQFHYGRSFGFVVINVCNYGEHYETPCIWQFHRLFFWFTRKAQGAMLIFPYIIL